MFRYDRPQAGRYRQFWQFDVEAIGDAGPAVDAEVIELASALLPRSGPGRRRAAPELDRRPGLPARLRRGAASLVQEARSGAARARAGAAWPPTRCGCWTPRTPSCSRSSPRRRASPTTCARRAATHFASVRAHLDALGIGHRLTPTLVRGLDYYTRTTFEFYPSRRRRRARRTRSAAAGATTGWSSCSGAGRRPGSASGWASTASPWPWRRPAPGVPRPRPRLVVVVGADPPTRSRGCGSPRTCARPGVAARADLAPRKLGQAARGRGREGAAFRGHLRRRARAQQVQLKDLAGRHAARRQRRRPGHASSSASEAQHRHGDPA